jgi:hypothetical protein
MLRKMFMWLLFAIAIFSMQITIIEKSEAYDKTERFECDDIIVQACSVPENYEIQYMVNCYAYCNQPLANDLSQVFPLLPWEDCSGTTNTVFTLILEVDQVRERTWNS